MNMTPEDLKKITEAVTTAVVKTVNGKIDKMQVSLDTHNVEHAEDMKRILPIVEAYETTKNTGKAAMWIASFIIAVGGAILVVKGFWPSH